RPARRIAVARRGRPRTATVPLLQRRAEGPHRDARVGGGRGVLARPVHPPRRDDPCRPHPRPQPPSRRRVDLQGAGSRASRGDGRGRARGRPVVEGPPRLIAIVDYGLGNIRSVERALVHVGAEVSLTSNPDDLIAADGIVLPGVGAFAPALARLIESSLGSRIVELARLGKPILGVCLGYQLLFEESTEHGRHARLGLLPGRVVEVAGTSRLPVIGWCRVTQTGPSPLW